MDSGSGKFDDDRRRRDHCVPVISKQKKRGNYVIVKQEFHIIHRSSAFRTIEEGTNSIERARSDLVGCFPCAPFLV